MAIVIRLYKISDRPAVRRICSDTADLGKPVENFFSDREIFADFLTGYYTDYETQALWVAESDTTAAGYLSGCLDNRRYARVMFGKVIPGVFIRAALRGVFWRKDIWHILTALFKSYLIGGFNRKKYLGLYPAHLHINLAADFRHQGLGNMLMERFLTQAGQANIPGVQAAVCQDNQPACDFFRQSGFSVLGSYPMVRPKGKKSLQLTHTLVYGVKL